MTNQIIVHTLEDIGQDNAGLQVVVLPDGQAFCTQSSYSRYANMSQQAISKRCQTLEVVDVESITNISSTTKVVDGKTLIKTKLDVGGTTTPNVILIPAKIFGKWAIKDIPALGDAIIEAGATKYLHIMAGYKQEAIPKPELTPREKLESLNNALSGLKELCGFDPNNPRVRQHIRDMASNIVLGDERKQLLPEIDKEKWCGVVERAEKLGFDKKLITKLDSGLGLSISHKAKNQTILIEKKGGIIQYENPNPRFMNRGQTDKLGREVDIKLYKINDALDYCIKDYFRKKGFYPNRKYSENTILEMLGKK